ncbi:MAG: AAA family ATPase [Bacilli bacterium]
MKPIRLEFQAFSSFKDKTVIDFTYLNESGIYLISGPTGSGKTTIFDALSFALFGEPSGNVRDSKNLRCDQAEDGVTTYVELIFEIQGVRYKIYRTPSQRKKAANKNVSAPEAILYYGDNFSSFIDKSDNVNKKIKELFGGLSSSDFKKIAMLAQGEFSKLIDSTTKDKREILRNIFKTDSYLQMSDKFVQRRKELKDKRTSIISYFNGLINSLKDVDRFESYYLITSDIIHYPSFKEEVGKYISSLTEEKKEKEQRKESLQKEQDSIKESIRKIKEDNELIKNINKAQFIYEEELKKKENINKKKKWLNDLLAFQVISSKEELYKQKSKDLLSSEKNLEKEKNKLSICLENIEKLNSSKEKIYENYSSKNKFEEILNLLKQVEEDDRKINELEGPYQKDLSNYDKINQDYIDKEKEFRNIEKAYFSSISVSLAKNLIEGMPCPVCGSTFHPSKAKEDEHYVSEEEYNRFKKELEYISNQKNDISNKLASSKGQINQLISQRKQRVEENHLEEYIENIKQNISSLDNKIKNIQLEYDNFIEREIHLTDEKENLEKNIDKYVLDRKNKQIECTDFLNQFNDALNESKVFTKETYEHFNKKEYTYDVAKKEVEEYEGKLARLHQTYLNLKVKGEGKEILDTSSLEESSIEKENNINQLTKEIQEINKISDNYSYSIPQLDNKYQEFNNIEHEYAICNKITQVINGEIGDKVNFETYVLGGFFDEIIEHANIRFKQISSSLYELRRRVESKDLRSSSGLELDVFDYSSGKVREISTLSGGERFKAALSLSLGLADIIESRQGAIDIASLFIDEGFGTLDQLSLEQAIKALIELQGENKTIGIISHVEQLKDMIDAQVVVSKTLQGSKIKIING